MNKFGDNLAITVKSDLNMASMPAVRVLHKKVKVKVEPPPVIKKARTEFMKKNTQTSNLAVTQPERSRINY